MDRLILLIKDIWQFPRKQKKDLNSKKLFGQLQKKIHLNKKVRHLLLTELNIVKKLLVKIHLLRLNFMKKLLNLIKL